MADTTDPRPSTDIEKRSPDPSLVDKAPDGGLRAWLVASGGFSILFCGLGFANSFGTFEEYYVNNQLKGHSPDDIAWIGSLGIFLQFAVGAFAGPLFDRYGAWMLRPTAVVYIFSMMMLSLCKTYWQIMLTQGVLQGICLGLLMFPAFAAVSQYFDKKRAAALGIVVAGSSVGGIVIPIALSKMLNSSRLGFGWSVRVIGFMILPLMLWSCVVIKALLPPRKTNFWIASAYKDIKFDMLVAASFFMFVGFFTPLFYLPTLAVSRGMSPTLAGYMLAILNAASTFGRIIPGILADKYGRLNMFALGGISTGIIVFCFSSLTNNAGVIVYAIVFGFFSGTIISGASAAFTTCTKDPREIGTYMGMGLAFASLAALIGPPVNGVLLSNYGFMPLAMFSGAMCLIGGLIAATSKAESPEGIFGRI
ncbi:uncharacterized protein LTR77_003904 [Saxophila tyrrhenica]|uniref:Major facilitator superfamily (MFS) profile domain-containing protein n=1 Tax=Saxophila tyrrhenica TaxID=1690608 RepID=A0AAV9PF64_9PEZI|nr:hypothetical protein LTR77_003904 [Saxophila tyrrhenica]